MGASFNWIPARIVLTIYLQRGFAPSPRQFERRSPRQLIEIVSESSTLLAEAKEVLLARLRNLLDQSGEPVPSADLETWLDDWMHSPLAELCGLTPAEIITSSRGFHELETLLERMRGGLAT
jgi:hypothetical protein